MTESEVLKELERLLVVTRIGTQYYISDDIYKRTHIIENLEESKINESEYSKILEASADMNEWPIEIGETRGRVRAQHFLAYCGVPGISKAGYRLKGLDADAVNIINKLVDTQPHIKADILFKAIAEYYIEQEYPKTFKNLVKEGDMLDLYTEALERYKEGRIKIDPNNKQNTTWG